MPPKVLLARESSTHPFAAPFALVVITLCVFGQASLFEFSQWDDWLNVIQNKHYNPPSLSNVGSVWTNLVYGTYIPLTYTVWGGLAMLTQLDTPGPLGELFNPYPFHIATILVHVINVLLVWTLARKLIGQAFPAFAVALIWGIHPMQAEAVAWITGLKDTLGGMFSLATILTYLLFVDRLIERKNVAWRWFGLSTLFMAGALLSKSTTVVVPLGIGLLVLYRTGRVLLTLPMLTWLMLVLPISILTATGRMGENGSFVWSPIWVRPMVAWDAISFYLWKLVAPFGLATDYGRQPKRVWGDASLWWIWIIPILALGACWLLRRRIKSAWLAPAWFVTLLLPVLGFLPFEYQVRSTVADRYAYLAMLGPMMAGGWLLISVPKQAARWIVTALALALSVLAFQQTRVWADSESLFTRVVAITPDSSVAYHNLGLLDIARGDFLAAETHFRTAIAKDPLEWKSYERLSDVLKEQRRVPEARLARAQALKLLSQLHNERDPNFAEAYFSLAQAQETLGEREGAADNYRRAMERNPSEEKYRAALLRLTETPATSPTSRSAE